MSFVGVIFSKRFTPCCFCLRKYLRYILHGVWVSGNPKVHTLLYYLVRATLEWNFVLNLVAESKIEMFNQVEQVVCFYMRQYVTVVDVEDGGIRPYVHSVPST